RESKASTEYWTSLAGRANMHAGCGLAITRHCLPNITSYSSWEVKFMTYTNNPIPGNTAIAVEDHTAPQRNGLDSSTQRSINGGMSMPTYTRSATTTAQPAMTDPFVAL